MHPLIYRRAFLLGYSLIRRDSSLAAYNELSGHDTLTAVRVRDIAEGKLRSLVAHTVAHVPYYQEVFRTRGLDAADIRSFDDLHQLPLITKADIRGAGERFFAQNLNRDDLVKGSTGGSSGTPFEFWHTREDRQLLNGNLWRVNGWMGCPPGTRRARVWGCYPLTKREQLISQHVDGSILLPGHDVSDDAVANFAAKMLRFRPKVIEGYGMLLYDFCRTIERMGIAPPASVRAAIYSAEVLGQPQRDYIERVLGCPLRQRYGSLEFLAIAAECSEARLHVTNDVNWVEIVDDRGNLLPPGEPGQIAVTCLHSRAYPLIRYLIGDLGIMDVDSCSCGLPYPVLSEVCGRSGNLLRLPDGTRVTGIAVAHRLRSFHVGQVQVRQTSKTDLRVLVKRDAAAVRDEVDLLLAELSDLSKHLMTIQFEYVDKIPRMPSGKYEAVACDWDTDE